MRWLPNILSVFKDRENILLLLIALFVPSFTGFQYLGWSYGGGTHLTFSVTSLTWVLTFSDWYFGVEGNLSGWLLLLSPVIPYMFLLPLLLLSPSSSWLSLFTLMTPLFDFAFVAAVILYKEGKIQRDTLVISGLALLVNSIILAVISMTINVIFGAPPGIFISIVAPDTDIRFFTPIPVLLVVGWYQTRKPTQTDSKT